VEKFCLTLSFNIIGQMSQLGTRYAPFPATAWP